ncbi:MAG: hypothetical protein U0Y82_12105 [Thermoleophilia bacterium]
MPVTGHDHGAAAGQRVASGPRPPLPQTLGASSRAWRSASRVAAHAVTPAEHAQVALVAGRAAARGAGRAAQLLHLGVSAEAERLREADDLVAGLQCAARDTSCADMSGRSPG